MGPPISKRRFTVDEYFRMERDSQQKHEFHVGEILTMAGNSPEHSLIAQISSPRSTPASRESPAASTRATSASAPAAPSAMSIPI